MFALKPGTKPCFLAHFLARLRLFSTRIIQDFHGDKISFRVVIQYHAALVFIAPLSGIVGPLLVTLRDPGAHPSGNLRGRESV